MEDEEKYKQALVDFAESIKDLTNEELDDLLDKECRIDDDPRIFSVYAAEYARRNYALPA